MTYGDILELLWGNSNGIIRGERVIWIYRTCRRAEMFGIGSTADLEYLTLVKNACHI